MDLQSVKQRFGIIGNSPSLNHALNIAVQVAATDVSVLISGESGVGKEVFSKILHQLSNRKHGKFIAVNCGAIPEGTIDSELFGHEKGSFTGAFEARQGYFETVNGGTIFLDELAEMPLGTQARLLRVLESGEFIKVGSSKVQKTDVRVIAASNVDLLDAIGKNKFREDLYYRLNTVSIHIPPLRERPDDIPLLFRKFAVDFAERYASQPISLDEQANHYLRNYPWPGNIRQLKNVAEQISVLAPFRLVEGEEILKYLPTVNRNSSVPMLTKQAGTEDLNEREILYKVLFDMKRDLNDLKKVVAQIVQNPDDFHFSNADQMYLDHLMQHPDLSTASPITTAVSTPVIQHPVTEIRSRFDQREDVEDIEENLSLEEVEKRMILRALKKHQGRRKNAAVELGISERTLYRKIKEYDIEV
jgi:transcriptional regulator with PAS, ATPase and Fis domain